MYYRLREDKKMTQKNFTVVLSAEAQAILDGYMAKNNCTRNKAVNELILTHKPNELMKYIKAIYNNTKK